MCDKALEQIPDVSTFRHCTVFLRRILLADLAFGRMPLTVLRHGVKILSFNHF